jgi:hypothetical protein
MVFCGNATTVVGMSAKLSDCLEVRPRNFRCRSRVRSRVENISRALEQACGD